MEEPSNGYVLILWADNSSSNLGVRVLAEGASRFLDGHVPSDTKFVFQDFSGAETGIPVSKLELVLLTLFRKGKLHSLIKNASLVLDTGAGDSFTDIYGLKRFIQIGLVQLAVIRMRKNFIRTPQTIGPFNTWIGRIVSMHLLQHGRNFVRDSISHEYVKETLKKDSVLSTDLVFLLPEITKTKNLDILLNVSGLLYFPNPHVDYLEYREALELLIQRLLIMGRNVNLLIHVLDNDGFDNDFKASKLCAAKYGLEIFVPEDLHSVRQLVARSQFVIGSRMHACLNSLSLDVPFCAWSYSRKFAPLFNDLGVDSVLSLNQTPEKLVEKTLNLLADSDFREQILASKIRAVHILQESRGTLDA